MNPQRESGSAITEASSRVNPRGAWELLAPGTGVHFKYSESYA